MSTSIIRVEKKSDNFTIISNVMLRDGRLSFAARGLLAHLLSRPNDWMIQTDDLIKQSDAGRDAVYGMLKELETYKYLKRERKPGAGGRFRWEITVYELPYDSSLLSEPSTGLPDTVKPEMGQIKQKPANQPSTEKPDTVKPSTGSPDTAKPDVTKKRINEETNNETIHTSRPRGVRELEPEREADIFALHAHYCQRVKTATLDAAAWKALSGALGEKGLAYCRRVVDGCALDDWPDRKINNSITFIFGKPDRMERLVTIAEVKSEATESGSGNGHGRTRQTGRPDDPSRRGAQTDRTPPGGWSFKNSARG